MDSAVNVALVIPLHGSAGIFGPSCELCAQLAVAEINAADGVLGRELRLSVIDGSGPPARGRRRGRRARRRGPRRRGRRLAHLRRAPGRRAARRGPRPVRLHRALRGRRADARRLPDRRGARRASCCRRCSGCAASTASGAGRSSATTTCGRASRPARRTSTRACATGRSATRRSSRSARSDWRSVLRRRQRSRADAVLMLLVGEDAVTLQPRVRGRRPGRRLPAPEHADRREHARRQRRREHPRHLRRGGLLRDAGHAREPRLRLALHAPLRPRRADAQQRGGVLLRGHPAARGARAARRQPRRAPDDRDRRVAVLRRPARRGAHARPPPRPARLPGRGRRPPASTSSRSSERAAAVATAS